MKFRCKRCGHNKIEEVLENVTVVSEVIDFQRNLGLVYSEQTNHNGEGAYYQCASCGTRVANSHDELVRQFYVRSEPAMMLIVEAEEPEQEGDGLNALQLLLESDEVQQVLAQPWAPSILHDLSYPDLAIVWDHGEGPHNPYAWADDVWKTQKCVPPSVWDFVEEEINKHDLRDAYTIVWLKGHEVRPCSP